MAPFGQKKGGRCYSRMPSMGTSVLKHFVQFLYRKILQGALCEVCKRLWDRFLFINTDLCLIPFVQPWFSLLPSIICADIKPEPFLDHSRQRSSYPQSSPLMAYPRPRPMSSSLVVSSHLLLLNIWNRLIWIEMCYKCKIYTGFWRFSTKKESKTYS